MFSSPFAGTCPYCGLTVSYEVYGKVGVGKPSPMVGESLNIEVVKCPSCDKKSAYLTDREVMPGTDDTPPPRLLFPTTLVEADTLIPESIRIPLAEFKTCLQLGLKLAGAMVGRKTLEQICIDKGGTKYNLHDKIIELNQKGVITDTQRDWADEIKMSGNDAAHEFDTEILTTENLHEVDDFLEELLDHLYRLPAKKATRQAARQARKSK